jgi:hypothetical protein
MLVCPCKPCPHSFVSILPHLPFFIIVAVNPLSDILTKQSHPPRYVAQPRTRFGELPRVVANRIELPFGGLFGRAIFVFEFWAQHQPSTSDLAIAPLLNHIGPLSKNLMEMIGQTGVVGMIQLIRIVPERSMRLHWISLA